MSSATELTSTIVSEIKELALAGQEVSIIDVKGESNGRYYLHVPGKEPVLVEPTPKNINDRLASPSELLLYLNGMKDFDLRSHVRPDQAVSGLHNKFDPGKGILIVTDRAIDFRFDFDGAYNRAHVILEKSHEWEILESLVGNKYSGVMKGQVEAYRLFRVDLKNALPAESDLAKLVRDVTWTNDETATGSISQARKTMGATIVGAVKSGGGELPESFELKLDVYKNFPKRVTVRVDLDTVPSRQEFRLTPYPGELERAVAETLSSIRELFAFGPGEISTTVCQSFIGAGGKD